MAELDTAPNADFEIAENVDSFLFRSVLSHAGQAGAGAEVRTSFSNSLPQDAHLYSKIGISLGRVYVDAQVYGITR